MHKKYSSFSHRDHHHLTSSSRRENRVKSRKGLEDSDLRLINVPQNSEKELVNRNLDIGEYDGKEKFKSYKDKDKHKHRHRDDHKHEILHDVTDIRGLLLDNEVARRKEKRDKDRLNKIEKYLEGMNKENKKITRHKSLSLDSSEVVLRRKERKIRREKTFQDKIERDATPHRKEQEIPTSRERSDKKRKRKDHGKRESSKDNSTKKDLESFMYCQVDTQSPFKQGKKKLDIERLYPKPSNKTSIIVSQIESTSKERHKPKAVPKPSSRKSKAKTETRHHKSKSDTSLTNKVNRKAQPVHERKKKHRKQDMEPKKQTEKKSETKERSKSEKTKRRQEQTSNHPDPYKAKIEDDIKSYFSRIQTLIDKKLDYILGNSTSKETKNAAENDTDKQRRKKEHIKETPVRERSYSKKRRRNDTDEERKTENLGREETKIKLTPTARDSRQTREITASSYSIDIELHPPEDPCNRRRRRSPQKRQSNSTEAVRHLNLSESEGNDLKMKPERLIKMLEHPSSFSLSNNSLANEVVIQEVKQRPKHSAERHRKRTNSPKDGLQKEDMQQVILQEALGKKHKHKRTVPVPEQCHPKLPQQRSLNTSGPGPSQYEENHHKRDSSLARRNTTPLDEICVPEMEQKVLQNKKLKKQLRQLMNLECKTVSIVGIPSQVRESTIFNETQTTTSLNVPVEDSVEQKKKSKRFKLYYKYSMADNKCPSDKSSDGMKSTVSDSYRVVSDPSDNNNYVWEEDDDKEKDDVTKYMFKMQKAKTKGHIETAEHLLKKYRKRVDTLKPIALNNILEEPSNISITIRRNETAHYSKKDVNCTFFKSLKSSSSDCILGPKKPCVQTWNIPTHKHRYRKIEKPFEELYNKSRSSSRKGHLKSDIKSNSSRKLRKLLSYQRIRTEPKKNKIKYTSRSDIDVSYDSLKEDKLSKEEQNSNTSDFIKEQLKEILPELFTQNPGPIRDSLDVILKKELKEIVKEMPINTHHKQSADNLVKTTGETVDCNDDESMKNKRETNSIEVNTTQSLEDQKQYSKKAASQTGTRIPTLIKGYVSTHQAAQVTSDDLMATGTSNVHVDTVPVKQSEKTLVSVATEISIGRKELMVVALEDKLSQTPQEERTKRSTAVGNHKIRAPFLEQEPKVLRTFTTSENWPSGNRRDRPTSAQSSRPKSSGSEKTSERLESIKSGDINQHLNRRPVTAQGSYTPKTPRSKRKPTLTMSTNVVTINTPLSVERGTEPVRLTLDREEYVSDVKTCLGETSSNVALSLDCLDPESRIGSLICVDRQSNAPKTNFSSNSRSLDQYTTKSNLSDNQHNGRLFLTKSFYPEMNTYQRRKVYDENIRRRMRKKHGSQSQIGPRVFEVRYLTLENGNLGENFEEPPVINQTCFTKLPTFGTRTNKGKQKTKLPVRKCRKNFPKNKEDACKYSGRDIFAPVITDVDQLNRFRRKSFPEKNVEEIFLTNEDRSTTNEENGTSSGVDDNTQSTKVEENSSEAIEVANLPDTKQNFKSLMDCLYNSILTYCNTKFEVPQAEKERVESLLKMDEKGATVSNGRSYIISKTSTGSSQKNVEEKQVKPVSNHLSCPVLAGSTSSFDYLYEDKPIDMNKETILLHFGKPTKTILGYTFNNTRPSDLPRKVDQMSSCATQSEESGYSSNQSKKCASVCSFFKRPSIANLFKPVKKLEACPPSTGSVSACRSGPSLQQYNAMNQKCIEYAEKVRMQSQNSQEPLQNFQEVPLDVLLFCRRNSEFFDDYNSNCSLCQKRSTLDIEIGEEFSSNMEDTEHCEQLLDIKHSSHNSLSAEKKMSELVDKPVHPETLIYYEDPAQRPSLEIVTFHKSHSNFSISSRSQITTEISKCPVIISITNLNPCSLTVIEEQVGNDSNSVDDFDAEHVQKEQGWSAPVSTPSSIKLNEVSSNHDSHSFVSNDYDGKSDISSILRHTTPSATNKYLAKKFFDNLLKVYEKEMNLSNKLFRDDDFFVNVLLGAVNTEISKTKSVNFKNFFKGKIKSVFSSKNETEVQELPRGPVSNHQKRLQILASDARKYFSMYVEAVRTNKGINDEVKICGLLKLLERIEDGDFAILRKKEDVDFEEEIRDQVKEAFVNTYNVSVKEAKKRKRCLTKDDLNLIRTFVSKYRIGLLSNTNLIATYIGRGIFKTESHLKAAVAYLIQQNKNKDIDLDEFDAHCKSLKCSE